MKLSGREPANMYGQSLSDVFTITDQNFCSGSKINRSLKQNDKWIGEVEYLDASGDAGSMGDLSDTLELIVQNEFQGASSELAASIQDSLVMHVAKSYQNVHDLGVKTAPFFVLVGSEMPAVLVEASFVSNEEEEAWLKSRDYREELAEAIEIGLQSYIDKRKTAATSSR